MVNPSRIIRSPDKENLRLSCVDVRSSVNSTMDIILKEIQMKRALLPRIIIFCKSTFDCAKLYTYFEMNMGPDLTEPPGASHFLQECRLVDMYFKGTETVLKNKIVEFYEGDFLPQNSHCYSSIWNGFGLSQCPFSFALWCPI